MRSDPAIADVIDGAIRARLASSARRPLVVGLCGAQGSGKSTLAVALAGRLRTDGIGCAILSLDDLYKTRAERMILARDVHPLFATRGAPGTHDVALGLAVLGALDRRESAPLPRFDKAADDRLPPGQWDMAPAGTQVLLFEGWLVGARPQRNEALASPVNALERTEDPEGIWRKQANAALAGEYRRLFARIDLLILLAAPGFDVVERWRADQERALRAVRSGGMRDAEIGRFVQHYERLTRHILADMPHHADIVIALDADRAARAIGTGMSVTSPHSA